MLIPPLLKLRPSSARPTAWHTARTTKHVWTDIGGAPSLVLQQVPLTHEMLPEAEVGDGYPMRPGSGGQSEHTLMCAPVGTPAALTPVQGAGQSCRILSAPLVLTAFLTQDCRGRAWVLTLASQSPLVATCWAVLAGI